jgi:hypothetical protein
MKLIVFLLAIGLKWSIAGVPVWGIVAVLAPVSLGLLLWYLRLRSRFNQPKDVEEDSDDLGEGREQTESAP